MYAFRNWIMFQKFGKIYFWHVTTRNLEHYLFKYKKYKGQGLKQKGTTKMHFADDS